MPLSLHLCPQATHFELRSSLDHARLNLRADFHGPRLSLNLSPRFLCLGLRCGSLPLRLCPDSLSLGLCACPAGGLKVLDLGKALLHHIVSLNLGLRDFSGSDGLRPIARLNISVREVPRAFSNGLSLSLLFCLQSVLQSPVRLLSEHAYLCLPLAPLAHGGCPLPLALQRRPPELSGTWRPVLPGFCFQCQLLCLRCMGTFPLLCCLSMEVSHQAAKNLLAPRHGLQRCLPLLPPLLGFLRVLSV
mmetsp:Transcript_626/g.1715  ORF Transcript_626/g.1715 Transcript_626/m.1715 type:complete len:246 (+) Transcript_626:911-1648(+)